MFVLSISLTVTAQERGRSFSPNFKDYYYLRTEFTGDELSLESNGAKSTYMDGAAFMSSQKGASGTMWKFVADPQNPGWYKLKSKDQGDGKCLEANSAGGVKGGRSFMNDCQNVTGQSWRLDLIRVNKNSTGKNEDHLYRLRSKLYGNTHALEGNKPSNTSVYKGNAFMDKTQNVTGQAWRLVPVN